MTAELLDPTGDVVLPDLLGTAPADLIDRYGPELPPATKGEARACADRIRAGLDSYTRMRQDIADAYARRHWIALGYAGWFEYVEAEFGAELQKLSRDERPEAAHDLRSQGMSTRQIGHALGVSHTQANRDLAHADQVERNVPPEKVTGSDGKTYPAHRTSTSDEKPPADRPAKVEKESAPAESRDRGRAAVGAIVDEERRRGEYMRNFHAALSKGNPWGFDAERVGREASPETFAAIEASVTAANHFLETARRSRSKLRVIKGGGS